MSLATVQYSVDFELDPELAEALDRYHKAAAERARRLAEEVDRLLRLAEEVDRLLLMGTSADIRTGSLFNPFRTYEEWVESLSPEDRERLRRGKLILLP